MSVPAAYIGVILIWSTTPLAIQWSGDQVGFLFGVTARMVLGLALCLLILRLAGIRLPLHQAARWTYVIAGVSLFSAMLSVYWSAQFIPSGWIAVIFGLAPLMTGVMASFWLGEQALTPARLTGMFLGIAGLAFIFVEGQAMGPDAGLGIAGVLFSATAHSAGAVWIKRINAGLPGLVVTTGALSVSVPLFLLVFFLSSGAFPLEMPVRAGASIVYLGVVGSVLGFAMYYYVLRQVEATRVALITLVTPVLALVLGNSLNGETIPPQVWGGTSLILSALLLYEFGGRFRRAQAARTP